MKRRRFSAEFKRKVILEAMRGVEAKQRGQGANKAKGHPSNKSANMNPFQLDSQLKKLRAGSGPTIRKTFSWARATPPVRA